METTNTTIHNHPANDEHTCIFFAQCPENDDLALYRSCYATALEQTGNADTARRAAESYMAGRLRSLPTWVR